AHAREQNDCAVRALALVLDKPYAEVLAACRAHGRKDRKGTYNWTSDAVLRDYGYERVTIMSKWHREGMEPLLYKSYTSIERDPRLAYGRYLIGSNRHVAAMIDGKLLDYGAGRRRTRVETVDALVPLNSPFR